MYEVVVSVEKERRDEMLEFLTNKIKINSIIFNECVNCDQFTVYLPPDKVGNFSQELSLIGCGVNYGIIKMVKIDTLKPIPKQTNNLVYQTRGKQSIEQVYSTVVSNIHLTSDYVMFCIVTAMIATIGLGTNNNALIIASMLLSPIMGPILGITLGTVINDKILIKRSLVTEFVSIVVIFITGFTLSIIFSFFAEDYNWPTEEMTTRGEVDDVILGVLVAIPSGIAIGHTVASGGINNLVGVAVAAALVPVLVNSGMLFAYHIMAEILEHNNNKDLLEMGLFSFAILAINIFLIWLASYIVLKIKYKGDTIRRTSVNWKFTPLKFEKKKEEDNESIFIDIFMESENDADIINNFKEREPTDSAITTATKQFTKNQIKEMLNGNLYYKMILKRFFRKQVEGIRKRKEEQKQIEKQEKLKKKLHEEILYSEKICQGNDDSLV